MKIVICLPKDVNLEELESKFKLTKSIKHYKRDKLAYLLSLPNSIASHRKKWCFKEGFVPLSSEILQDNLGNYKEYLDALVQAGVLETNNRYVVGNRSKGYRISQKYAIGVRRYKIKDKMLCKRLKKKSKCKSKIRPSKYKNLNKWFNKKLSINIDNANWYINQELNIKIKHPSVRDSIEGVEKSPILQHNSAQILIGKFENHEFDSLSLDDSGLRYHSPLTNLQTELRNCISYDGQELCSIDIKNSQPYLSTLLLKPDFWRKAKNLKRYKNIYYNILSNNNQNHKSPFMLQSIMDIHDKPDIQRYIELVISGEFYEYFEEEFKKEYHRGHKDYKELKGEIFHMLYSCNRTITDEKKLFKKLFPNVYKTFKIIKTKENNLLPIILQRVESDIILNDICCYMKNNYPLIPIFTIHDSIATTVENKELLEKVMRERLKGRVGFTPQLQVEYWNESNLSKKIVDLEERVK